MHCLACGGVPRTPALGRAGKTGLLGTSLILVCLPVLTRHLPFRFKAGFSSMLQLGIPRIPGFTATGPALPSGSCQASAVWPTHKLTNGCSCQWPTTWGITVSRGREHFRVADAASVACCVLPPQPLIAACGMLHADASTDSSFSVATTDTPECQQQQALGANGGKHSCSRCPIIYSDTEYDMLLVAEAAGAVSDAQHIPVSEGGRGVLPARSTG